MKSKIILMVTALVLGSMTLIQAQSGNNNMMNSNMSRYAYMHNRMMMDTANMGNWGRQNMPGMMNGNFGMQNRNMMYNRSMGMNWNMDNDLDGVNMQVFMQFQPYIRTIIMLPRMQKYLSLTNDQLTQLIDIRADYRKAMVDMDAKLQKMKLKTQEMMDNNATPDDLEVQLSNSTLNIAKMALASYETAGKMKMVLNDKQLKLFNDRLSQCDEGNCNMDGGVSN